MGLDKSGLLDTHPSNGDRIRAARRAAEPGVFQCDLPATVLFSRFDIPARQVTALHYDDDLGIPIGLARLVPLSRPRDAVPEIEAPLEPMDAKVEGKLRLKR